MKITNLVMTGIAISALTSCTFHNTMKRRQAENIELQKQHAAETARTEELQKRY